MSRLVDKEVLEELIKFLEMMKQNFYKLLCFLTMLVIFVIVPPIAESAPIRLAVINTTRDIDNSELSQQSKIITANFIGSLAKSSIVTLLERDELEIIIREQKINASQLEQRETAVKLGKLTGCQYVLLCSTTYNDAPIIGAQVIEVETSEIIFSATEISQNLDETSVIAASSRLGDQILKALTGAQAFIADIKGKDIQINRGSSTGVRIGNFYRVYRTPDSETNLAIIKIKNVRPDFSVAEVIKNGGDFKKLRRGDSIEAVSQKEAQSIIKGKKIKKLTPQKSADSIAEKFNDKNEERAVKFFRVIEQSMDIFERQAKDALTQDKPKPQNSAGVAFKKLGDYISQNKNFFAHSEKLTTKQVTEKIDYCYSKAFFLYTKAAEQGFATAQSNLGLMYEKGKGVKQDYEKAAEWYRKSAEQGNKYGQNNLGHLYRIGKGVPQDYKKAVEYYTKAAEQGYAQAQTNLGFMYEKGYGVEQDYKKAIEFYEKAAEQENPLAINNLGAIYANGLGVEQDYAKAIEYYRKAAAKGNELAKKNLRKLGASLN